jgi:SAM-dependent methyltransferase
MFEWYCRYYAAAPTSKAHAAFCKRVYGRNLCQHGFADMAQLNRLLEVAGITRESNVLDVGCGIGLIAEYLSGATGAHVHGVDNVPDAIKLALARTTGKRARLTFAVQSLDHLELPPRSFQVVVAIDSLYFTDLDQTVRQMRCVLAPSGRLVAYYSYALHDHPEAGPETLAADRTPLAESLRRHGLTFEYWDFTDADYQHALLRKRVLAELELAFASEGNSFLYDNRLGEAKGIANDIEARTHRRYLYAAAS